MAGKRLAPKSKKPKADKGTPKPIYKQKWFIPVAAVLVIAIVVFAVLKANVKLPDDPWNLPDQPSPSAGSSSSLTTPRPAEHRLTGVYTFLFIGVDNTSVLTDTLMVAKLDVENHKLGLVSILRDTYIPQATRSLKKINGAWAGKNMDRLLDEVSMVVGFRPDYTVKVNLKGFVALVDAVGGVDFDVPKKLSYDDPTQNLHIHFEKGMQHLTGQQALEVARNRHGYVTQDFQRTEVQRDLLKAIAKKVLTPAGVISLLPKLNEVVTQNLETTLSWGNITALAMEASKIDMDVDGVFGRIPTKTKSGPGDYQEVIKDEAVELINRAINPYKTPITVDDLGV
ncbi:hypothetical protein FACS1894217_02700 [Clostridia bacterium]|nr:hypothetical protein FACS1894217_02700 [Clostridia bacterium]